MGMWRNTRLALLPLRRIRRKLVPRFKVPRKAVLGKMLQRCLLGD
jgi:hypothetical protein